MRFLSALGRMLLSRTMVILIGLLALGLLVWFLGPYIQLFGSKPLVPAYARIVAIGALVALFAGLELFRYWRIRRQNRRMIESLTNSQSLAAMAEGAEDEEIEVLRQRFEDAMAALKETSVSGRHMYDLPWYLIIGPPGSGKTTILRNSGLQFPLAERLGVEVVEGIGGTRSCDWWLTDQAVLIDTAGRYTTQDVNAPSDASTWRGFLNMLKENRPRQPVNGVIVAISLAEIIEQDPQQRKRTIDAVKARLQELMRGLGIRMPVYVIFTKTDLVAGFSEFFEDLDEEGREQVWGVTLPFQASSTSAAAMSELHGRIDGLLERLSSHVPRRLNEERSVERRRRIYAFPEQVAGIRPMVEEFLEEVFRPNRYSMQPLFRGLYFTSGTQVGAPIDRMQSAYAQAFGFDAPHPSPHQGPVKPFFINRLMTDVVFRERGIVGRDRKLERRLLATNLAIYAACLLIVAGLGVLWYHGEQSAEDSTAQFDSNYAVIQKLIGQYEATPSLATAIPPLTALRQEVDNVQGHTIEEALEWVDLDANSRVREPLEQAYVRLVRKIALPEIKKLLEQSLRQAAARGDNETTAELLKLYLELGSNDKFERQGLEQWLTLELEQAMPLRPDLRQALDQHSQALFDNWPGPQPLDQDLIATARKSLISVPPVDQIYAALEAEGERFPSKDLNDIIGLDGIQFLVRRSPSALAPQIPYLYTAEGFYNVFLRRLPTLGQKKMGEDWVIGADAKAASEEELTALLRQATDRYVKKYIATWQAFLADIDIRDLRDIGDANTVLATLSGTQSPVNRLLTFVADNTNLPFQPSGSSGDSGSSPNLQGLGQTAGAAGRAAGKAQAAASKAESAAGRLFGSAQAEGPLSQWPGTPITKAFAPIQALVRGSNGQRPGLGDIQQNIVSAYGQINAIDTASDVGKASFEAVRQRLKATDQRDALTQLSNVAVSQPVPLNRILAALPPNLWRVMIDETRGYLNDQWRRDVVGECTRAIFNRYPVYRDGRDETTTQDFGTFFGPGGTIETFQNSYLADFIDTSGRPWKNRDVRGNGLNLSATFLNSLENAATVRDTFFRSGTPTPSVNFTLRPTYLDSAAARVTIDTGSKLITYRHEPPRTFNLTWPDPGSGQKVTVTMTDINGNTNSIQATGPWAWFRLFDQVNLQKTGLADKFVLPIDIRGRKATFELNADSITNPFELPALNQYRCQPGL